MHKIDKGAISLATMRRLKIAEMVILVAAIPISCALSHAQNIPSLTQGQPYNKERKKLLSSGWQKVINYTKNCSTTANGAPRNVFSREACLRYQEHEECSATSYYAFAWKNANGKGLRVITYGDSYNVQNWELE